MSSSSFVAVCENARGPSRQISQAAADSSSGEDAEDDDLGDDNVNLERLNRILGGARVFGTADGRRERKRNSRGGAECEATDGEPAESRTLFGKFACPEEWSGPEPDHSAHDFKGAEKTPAERGEDGSDDEGMDGK